MPLKILKKKHKTHDAARSLYKRAVEQARQPRFYAELGVPDTLDGRFDMVALHVFLLLHRLKLEGAAGARLGQSVFDVMFEDMDGSLREIGVGDLSVGRRVKAMATAFYGRIAAYGAGLAAGDEALAGALARNLFRGTAASPAGLTALCAYLRREAAALAALPYGEFSAGCIAFGLPPAGR